MKALEEIFSTLCEAWESGAPSPDSLKGQLTDDNAYRCQLRMLARRVSQGQQLAGWKIGQTNRQMRIDRGEAKPAPGFLLESDRHSSGAVLDLAGATDWSMEPELAFVLSEDLVGPDLDRSAVRSALAGVAPAMELVRPRKDWPDRALQRAVNGSTSGFVLGPLVDVRPTGDELDALDVVVSLDGAQTHHVRGGDVNDNPLDSVAWLGNYLTMLGETLRAGQVVLTGSYAGLIPLTPGQRWSARLGPHGTVELSTV